MGYRSDLSYSERGAAHSFTYRNSFADPAASQTAGFAARTEFAEPGSGKEAAGSATCR